jgi:hypothetical protein
MASYARDFVILLSGLSGLSRFLCPFREVGSRGNKISGAREDAYGLQREEVTEKNTNRR